MITDYLIITSIVAGITVLWRTIKNDYPRFKAWVGNIPVVGEALNCGVCTSYWFSLVAVLVANPLANWHLPLDFSIAPLTPLADLLAQWICLGTSVLLLRSVIIVLLDLGAILSHRHRSQHQ